MCNKFSPDPPSHDTLLIQTSLVSNGDIDSVVSGRFYEPACTTTCKEWKCFIRNFDHSHPYSTAKAAYFTGSLLYGCAIDHSIRLYK